MQLVPALDSGTGQNLRLAFAVGAVGVRTVASGPGGPEVTVDADGPGRVVTRSEGDCLARFELLLEQVHVSLDLAEACVDRLRSLPQGPINVRLPKILKAPEGSTYAWTENPDPRLYSGWDEFVVQWASSMWTRGEAFICSTGMDWESFLPNTFMVLDPDRVQPIWRL